MASSAPNAHTEAKSGDVYDTATHRPASELYDTATVVGLDSERHDSDEEAPEVGQMTSDDCHADGNDTDDSGGDKENTAVVSSLPPICPPIPATAPHWPSASTKGVNNKNKTSRIGRIFLSKKSK